MIHRKGALSNIKKFMGLGMNNRVINLVKLVAFSFLMLGSIPAFAALAQPQINYPTVDYGAGDTKKLIQKGEYLVKAGDCVACHTDTDNNGAPFAGGLGVRTPFGTFYTPASAGVSFVTR